MITDKKIIMNDTEPCVLFGKKLRQIRELQALSQENLAELSGLDRTYIISGVERGKRNVALKNICKIAQALNIAPHELLNF